MSYFAIATWQFSLEGMQKAAKLLKNNGDAMDAAVLIAKTAENNPDVHSVGFGAIPNRDGELELDAAVMDGKTLNIAAVSAVKGFKNPSEIAKNLLAMNKHTFLTARGAEEFALRCGHKKEMLITGDSIRNYYEKKNELEESIEAYAGHDTIGAIAMDNKSNICACTSTSGIYLKHPGRVGDTPLPGCGYYVDDEIGGATATGVGEDIMKGCVCFHIVELMRLGATPHDAANEAVMRLHKRLAVHKESVGNIAVVCMDKEGRYGAAANHDGFAFSVAGHDMEPCTLYVNKLFNL